MADDVNEYYRRYHQELGENAYTMGKAGDTSRIFYLEKYITQYVPAGGKILDVGCGDFDLSRRIEGFDWHGIDVAPAPSASNPERITTHDLMTTPYPYESGTFDAVVCSEVLEHLWDLRKVHAEVKRLLKPQGTYIVSTPNFEHIDLLLTHHRHLLTDFNTKFTVEHIRHYTFETHSQFLSDAGFRVVEKMGADAHYSAFFLEARRELQLIFRELGMDVAPVAVDAMLGRMFKDFSHTCVLVSKPV